MTRLMKMVLTWFGVTCTIHSVWLIDICTRCGFSLSLSLLNAKDEIIKPYYWIGAHVPTTILSNLPILFCSGW